MLTHKQSCRRWAFTALAIGLFAAVGTAAAQTAPEPKGGTYGGSTYGGATYGGATYGAAQPAPAPAAEPAPAPVAMEPEPSYEPMAVTEKSTLERWGFVLALGGGVEGFTDSGDTGTDTGGNWNVRASIGTKQLFGFEASYIGSAQAIEAIGLDTDAYLVGNGLQGALRMNLITGYGIDFFALGGLAWRHYDLSNESFNTSDVQDTDDVLEVPLGGGMQWVYEGFLLDARAEYRFTSYGDLFANDVNTNDNMDRWGVNANIGYQW